MSLKEDNAFKSALKINKGVESPSSLNSDATKRLRKLDVGRLSPLEYFVGIREGNRTILSKAITLVESSLEEHQDTAQKVISLCLPYSGNSVRIGITGVPGVGKSTFIEAFGNYLTSIGKTIAVLAIDPSSTRSKGSILGDKTRMDGLSKNENVFIRPSPSAGSLGGIARKTRETVILCEAAGFNTILIETVGVGQSETVVHSIVDFFLLLMLAGAGDELQGIKRGIIEMADAIFVNKADGDNLPKVNLALTEIRNALHLFNPDESGWSPVVESCSAITGEGISHVWTVISNYLILAHGNHYFQRRRQNQARQIMYQAIENTLLNHFYRTPVIKKLLKKTEEEVLSGTLSADSGAKIITEAFFNKP